MTDDFKKRSDKHNPRNCTVCGKVGNGQRCSIVGCPERKLVTAQIPSVGSNLFDGGIRAGKPPHYDDED